MSFPAFNSFWVASGTARKTVPAKSAILSILSELHLMPTVPAVKPSSSFNSFWVASKHGNNSAPVVIDLRRAFNSFWVASGNSFGERTYTDPNLSILSELHPQEEQRGLRERHVFQFFLSCIMEQCLPILLGLPLPTFNSFWVASDIIEDLLFAKHRSLTFNSFWVASRKSIRRSYWQIPDFQFFLSCISSRFCRETTPVSQLLSILSELHLGDYDF